MLDQIEVLKQQIENLNSQITNLGQNNLIAQNNNLIELVQKTVHYGAESKKIYQTLFNNDYKFFNYIEKILKKIIMNNLIYFYNIKKYILSNQLEMQLQNNFKAI